MKLSIAQIKPVKGDIKSNIEIHKRWIDTAISQKSTLIAFPELSLIGYEPELAKALATDQNDSRLHIFQKMSDLNDITIGLGLPTKSNLGILISLVFFQPNKQRQTYSKQHLHDDESPYFVEGSEQLFLTIGNKKIAPAICYESLLKEHSDNARKRGADIYLASVAKSERGIEKAFEHFPEIAAKYAMPVLMSNCIGLCDNFMSAGQSAVWDSSGILKGKLSKDEEGMLVFDTKTQEVVNINSMISYND